MFSCEQLEALAKAGDVVRIETVQPLSEISALFEGDEERILAIDPDSCDWAVPNDVLDRIPNLKGVVLETTSFSWVDGEHLKQRGIPLMNCPGFSSIAVAEWAVMAMLMLARKMPLVIKNDWKLDFESHRGFELREKTAGVIGLGRIGKAVAENCSGLGMNVQYWSRQARDERFLYSDLESLLSTSDVVFLCLARNEETSTLLTDELLHKMKPTTVFVRTGFAPNHELLLSMVRDGHLGGYAFDEDHSTFSRCAGNVLASPPLGWLTHEAVARSAQMWTDAIVSAAQGEYPTRVN